MIWVSGSQVKNRSKYQDHVQSKLVENKTTSADNRISKETLSSANKYVAKHEPKFVGGAKEISADFFYYGKGMQHKWITSSKANDVIVKLHIFVLYLIFGQYIFSVVEGHMT